MNTLRSARARHILALLLTALGLLAAIPAAAQRDFYTVDPCRQYDRSGSLDLGTVYSFPVIGTPCDVPANAVAVALNVTIISPGSGYLVAYPTGGTPPGGDPLVPTVPIGSLVFNQGRTQAKNFIVDVGTGGEISVNAAITPPTPGIYRLAIDIAGYFLDNDPSQVGNDSATVLEDATATPIDVLANDTDSDDTLSITSASDPANGTVVLTPVGPGPYTGLTYQPDANYCNAPPGTTPDTFTYTLNTGSIGTVEVTVTCVNDAPAGTDGTIGTGENTERVFTAADFGFTDPNDTPANALLAVVITTLPGAGTIELSNVAVTAGQSIAVADVTAGNLTFTPAAGANGTPYASFTFQVQDDGGTANSGIDLDQTPNTLTINVNSVNDPPAGTDNTITFNEDGSHTFSAADFGFTDPSDTPADAFQAVTITTLPAAGSLTLSAVPVSAGQSIPVGSIGSLVFTPVANANGTPYTSFTFQVQDDGGGTDLDPTPNTITFNLTAVNDAPAGTNNTVTTPEDTQYTFTVADFGLTDPVDTPANALQSVIIATLPGAGSLTLSGNPVIAGQEIPAASITAGNLRFTPAANASGTSYASFTFQVRDNGGTANGGIDLDASANTMTIDVTAANDAPAGTDNTVTTLEETQYTFTVADFGFTDPNDTPANALASVVITTLPGAGSLTLAGNPVIAGQEIPVASITAGDLRFTPAANGSGSPYASFTFQVRDDGGTAGGGIDLDASPNTMTVDVTPVNDAPAGTNNTVTTLEETPYTFSAANFGFTDPNDTPPNTFASVVITTLSFPVGASLTLAGNPVIAGQEIPVASIGNLVFTPAANASGISYASFTFQVRDNGGTANTGIDLDPTPNTMTIDVTAVNDAPAGTDNAVTTPEDIEYIFDVADFGFTDPNDTPANALASVVISTLPGAGSLTLSGSGFAAGTEIPVASITAGNLRFQGAANAFGSPYTSFTFRVRDNGGTANSGVDLDPVANTMTINVTPVPDAPLAIDEGTLASPYVETVGNTILEVDPLSDLPGAKVYFNGNILTNDSDPDGPTTFTVTLESATAGAVVTFHPSDGTFTYVPPPGFTGVDSFTYRITDPELLFDTATVYINVEHRVWYVRNNTATPGTAGTSEDPFDTLGEAESASGQNDTIYLFEGDGTTADQSDGITLKNGQRLLGEAVQLAVPTAVNINGTAGLTLRSTTGNRPKIENDNTPDAAGEDNGVSVPATAGSATGVEIRGLEIGGFDNAIDVTASGANTVGITISNNHIRGASTEGIDLNASGTGIFTSTVQNNTWALAGTHTGNAFDARTGIAGANLRVNFSGNVDILTTGGAASAVFIDGTAGGTVTITGFSGNSVHENTAGNGIVVNSATFDADAAAAGFQQVNGGATFIGDPGNGVGNSGIDMNNVSGDLAFTNLGIYADGNLGLRVNGTGAFAGATGTRVTVTAGVGVIEAVNSAVTLSSITADLQLASLKSTGTTTNGVSLTNVSDGGGTNAMFSAGSGSSIIAAAGATGPIFNVSGGNAAITFPGLITNNSTSARAVSLTTWSGNSTNDNITLSGAIDENGAGILVNGTSGTCNGDSDGCPITFSGGMDVDTTTGEGFAATSNTGSVRLHVTGTNDITSTSATALRVTATSIGSSNLSFRNVSSGNNTAAADPASGIVLNGTGTLGRLIVTGSGSSGQGGNASGGLIQNMTSHGISLTDTMNPSFTNMSIQGTAGSGVNGSLVAGFTFDNGTINNSGTGGAADDSNISFNDSSANANVSGTVTVTDSVLTNSRFHGVDIQHYNGTIAHADIQNNAFTSTASIATSLGSAIRLDAYGTAAIVGQVTRATINNNVITNFPTGAGIHAFGGNSGGSGPAGTFGVAGSGTDKISITNNLMNGGSLGVGNQPDRFFTGGVTGTGQGNFDISGNGTLASPITNIDGVVIELNHFGTGSMTATVNNNRIVANNAVGSAGINVGCDADGTSALDNAVVSAVISGNNVSDTDGPGIFAIARGSDCNLTARILGNTVAAPDTTTAARAGIRVDSGSAAGNTTLCLEMSGNTTAGSTNTATVTTSPGINLRKQGTSTTTNIFGIEGLAPSPAGSPTVENHVNGLNTSTSGTFGVNGTALLSAASGFTSCVAP